MPELLDRLRKRAAARCPTLAFPEGADERVVEAAAQIQSDGVASPVLIGSEEAIESTAAKEDIDLSGVETVDPKTARDVDQYVSEYQAVRSVSADTAKQILGNELLFAGLLVRLGEADAMIGGCVRTSGDLIAAAKEVVGLREGISVPSSFFLIALPEGQTLIYADAAVNVDPSAEELADIVVASARSVDALLEEEPKVALLSFSTRGSASHPHVEKVQEATELAKTAAPDFDIDGEFQGDAALDEATAQRKIAGTVGPVAGRANTLVFPDLDAGNIAYKLTQELAGADAYGPVLQGFVNPVCDLSRGATVEDIVGAAVITAALVEEER